MVQDVSPFTAVVQRDVRGRTGRTATLLESTPDSPEFGGVAQAFTTAAISPQPQQSDLIRELEAIRRLGQKGRAKQAQEDAGESEGRSVVVPTLIQPVTQAGENRHTNRQLRAQSYGGGERG